MTSHQWIIITRWLLVPAAAVSGIIASALPSLVVNRIIHSILWSSGHHMPGKDFMFHFSIPVCGAFAAFFFVLFGTRAAPKHRLIVALALFVTGGIVAWMFLGGLASPHIQAGVSNQVIWEPTVATYSGGLIACVAVCFRSRLSRMFRFRRFK